MNEEEIKDVKGQTIEIGDVVFRSKFGALSIHRVLRRTKQSLVLSIHRDSRTYGIEPNLRRYYFIRDTRTLESLQDHNDTIYVPIRYMQFSLIKY